MNRLNNRPDSITERLLWMEDKYTFRDGYVRYSARCWVCDARLMAGWRVLVATEPGTETKMFYACHHHELDQEVLL